MRQRIAPHLLRCARSGSSTYCTSNGDVWFAAGAGNSLASFCPGCAPDQSAVEPVVAEARPSLVVSPSPGYPRFTIGVSLAAPGYCDLAVFDVEGRRVATIFTGRAAAGRREHTWDASVAPPGVYFCRLAVASGHQVRKFVVGRR